MSASTPVADPMATSHKSLKRSISNTLKGSAGNLVEWYDVYVYSVFASYFESKFFSAGDKNATLYVWAIFAVTFLMRPIGAWFFGRYADRHGRRASLTLSVTLMAICSFGIAIVPTAETIGVGAAIILVIARLLQGFATGGEYGASATYMSEAAVPGHRGLLSSFHYVTLVGGHVLAQLTLFLLLTFFTKDHVVEWGWRVGFAIGGVSAIVVFWLRRTMDESLSETAIADAKTGGARKSGSLKELFVNQWRPLLLCFLITAGGTLAFYTYSVTGPKMIQTAFAGDDIMKGTVLNLIALTVLMLLQPVGGWLSDRIGRKTLLVFFGVGSVAYTWYLITALPQQTTWGSAFAILVIGFVILTGYTSINAVVKAELFPTYIRALGVGLGYALANSVFGGTAPLLYQWAKGAKQMDTFIIYATVVMFISLLVYVFALKNKGSNWLDHEDDMHARHGSKR
ncbi:MFS transporter, MHS family, alpha-ketoglutarate permease [Pseudoxanthomonas sp. GM95]|uniref:MFS transporter n=1 Tax=Pseudoxanthomonas sp. GM95 TaxID=1881043 RepID=UPI0008C3845E|nr:MFS transporter [Pseudoxanthomonas sp. GM95]SEL76594.1 MFS transporter, MHS family, alpha-ketoglutarate permease [Pseudoxanthomonas sp. GM95]